MIFNVDDVFQQEMEEEAGAAESSKFLLSHDDPERAVDPEMQARLETLLEVAGEWFLNYNLKNFSCHNPMYLSRLYPIYISSHACSMFQC